MNPVQFNTAPNFIEGKKKKKSFSSITSEGLIFTFPPAAGSMKFSQVVKSETGGKYLWKRTLFVLISCFISRSAGGLSRIVTGSGASRGVGGEGTSPPCPRALIFGPPAFGVESTRLPLALLALALTSEGKDGSNYGTHN